ncbi:unnamed protein product [Brassica rapa subsp. trilocularis]
MRRQPSRYVFCIFRSWVYCMYSSAQHHHELRVRTYARNMEDHDSTPRLKASFNLAPFIDLEPTFINEVRRRTYRQLFDPEQLTSGNNLAEDNYTGEETLHGEFLDSCIVFTCIIFRFKNPCGHNH